MTPPFRGPKAGLQVGVYIFIYTYISLGCSLFGWSHLKRQTKFTPGFIQGFLRFPFWELPKVAVSMDATSKLQLLKGGIQRPLTGLLLGSSGQEAVDFLHSRLAAMPANEQERNKCGLV